MCLIQAAVLPDCPGQLFKLSVCYEMLCCCNKSFDDITYTGENKAITQLEIQLHLNGFRNLCQLYIYIQNPYADNQEHTQCQVFSDDSIQQLALVKGQSVLQFPQGKIIPQGIMWPLKFQTHWGKM